MFITVAALLLSLAVPMLPSTPAAFLLAHRPAVHLCTLCLALPFRLDHPGFCAIGSSLIYFSATSLCLIHMVHIAGSVKPRTRDPSFACQVTDTVFTMPLLGGLGARPTQCASASPLSRRLSGINSCLFTPTHYSTSSAPKQAIVPNGVAPYRLPRRQLCTMSAYMFILPSASRP